MLRKLNFFILIFILGVLFATDRPAETVKTEFHTQKFVLDNGLTVLVNEMPESPAVSVYGFVKTGSATEGRFLGTGISHFLEHMLFKGTDKRKVGQIASEVQALGGQINASTSFDYTIYTLDMPAPYFDQALDIISDMLQHSQFDQIEIDKEREVVYGEIRLYKDNPDRVLSERVFDTAFKQHPYRLPIIGYEELLRPLKREDFVEYYRTHYAPNNVILSIAGPVKSAQVIKKVQQAFKDSVRERTTLRNLVSEPPQMSSRYYEEEYPTELARFSMVFQGVSLLDDDMFAMDVLALILGQGESSRLYKEVFLKQRLVHSINASNFTPVDRGIFEIEVMLDEDKIEKTVSAVKAEIAKISSQGVDPGELEKVKRQALASHVFDRQTSDALAYSSASDEAFLGDCEFSKKYLEALKKLTVSDIKRVAAKYLVEQKMSLVVLKPKKDKDDKDSGAAAEVSAQIQKTVLANGLTILLRENHRFSLISFNVAFGGGTGQEKSENNGVTEMTSRLLVSGTKSRTAENISETTEARGARLSPFAGRQSFGFSFNVLSDDQKFALDLLEDLLKNSTFPEERLNLEREQIQATLKRMEDNISVVASRNLRQTLFLTHPLRLEGLGTFDSIAKMKREDVLDFYSRFGVPNNMVVSAFGDFDPKEMLAALTKRLGTLNRKDVELVKSVEAPPTETRQKELAMNKQQAMVMFGFQGVDLKSQDRAGLQILTSILGSSFSGRLFTTVRDEFGQAYTLGGSFTPGRDMGLVSFYVLTTEASVPKVKELIFKLFKDIREQDVSEAELTNIKTYLKGAYLIDLQTDATLGFVTALDELNGTGFDFYQKYSEMIDRATIQDVRRLAEQYLDPKKGAVVTVLPQAPQ